MWDRRKGTQLREVESGFRDPPATYFETFPFADVSEEQRSQIAEGARHLDELRCNWLDAEGVPEAVLKERTLTKLYNERMTWFENTRGSIGPVIAAYGRPADLADEEVLQNLLTPKLERS